MYIRFTPLQLKKTKEFMKSVKLSAYDITIYNEILKALDKPEEEILLKQVKQANYESANRKNNFKDTNYENKKNNSINGINNKNDIHENNKLVINDKEQIIINNLEKDNIQIDEQLDSIDERINNIQLDNQIDFNSEVENAPPMSVIDRRTKKTSGYYI